MTPHKSSPSPCSTQSPALRCCWCAACTGAAFAGTWEQRAGPRSAEPSPGPTGTAPSDSTWASPSGLGAPKPRSFPPARRWPSGARPRSSAALHLSPVRTAEARILSDRHPRREDWPLALFQTPSRSLISGKWGPLSASSAHNKLTPLLSVQRVGVVSQVCAPKVWRGAERAAPLLLRHEMSWRVKCVWALTSPCWLTCALSAQAHSSSWRSHSANHVLDLN